MRASASKSVRARRNRWWSAGRPPARVVLERGEVPVTADDAAQISAFVRRRLDRRHCERPGAHQLAVPRQVGTLQWPAGFGPRHVLPPAPREEPVIAADDDLRPVLQGDAVRLPADHPVVQHLGDPIAAVGALAHRSVDAIARPDMPDRASSPVRHQDLGIAPGAVNTSMTATAVRVDRPLERDVRGARHAIERGLAADLVEAGVERLRRVEPADHRGVGQAGDPALLVGGDGLSIPAHEHMFAYGTDGAVSGSARAG